MFQSSYPSQCFDTISSEGTALHFLVITPEEQEILDNIPGWRTDEDEENTAALKTKSSQQSKSHTMITRAKTGSKRQIPSTSRERTSQQFTDESESIVATSNTRMEIEKCIPLLHNDLFSRRCRSLPSLVEPFDKLSVQAQSVSDEERSRPGGQSNQDQQPHRSSSSIIQRACPSSPSDRRLILNAINHNSNETLSQTIRKLNFANELSVLKVKKKAPSKSNSCSLIGSRLERDIQTSQVASAKSFTQGSSVRLPEKTRSQDQQSSSLNKSNQNEQRTQRYAYSLRLACIDEDSAESQNASASIDIPSSINHQLNKNLSQRATSTRLSKKHHGTLARRETSKTGSSVNVESTTALIEMVNVKQEKVTPIKRSTQCLDTTTVLHSQSQILDSVPVPSTFVMNSLEVPYIGPIANRNDARHSYLIGDETQTACFNLNKSDFNSSNETSNKQQEISPFSSVSSIACGQPNIPEILARLASPTGSDEDCQNQNPTVNISSSSRDLFLSQEPLSQQSQGRPSARKRLCFEPIVPSISNHHINASAKKRRLEPSTSTNQNNITASKTRSNTINLTFSAAQRRDMASVILNMYK